MQIPLSPRDGSLLEGLFSSESCLFVKISRKSDLQETSLIEPCESLFIEADHVCNHICNLLLREGACVTPGRH